MEVELTNTWNRLLDAFPSERKDVYFTEEYVKLYENETEKADCFVCRDGEKVMLFPLLKREFIFRGKTYKDFETAYGYGGPICNCGDKEFLLQALTAFKQHCHENGYVAGFVRFHPLMNNQEGFESIGRILAERKTVAIDLNQSMDDVWKNEIHSKNRNMIRKAEKLGCKFIVDDNYKYLPEFIRLYDQTMDKLSASSFYYFNDSYYNKLKNGIPDSFIGCVVNAEDKIISAAIFMYNGAWGHYHLSGSDKSQLALSPNNLMLWSAACELQKRGVKLFHLGGGTNSDEDNPLFLFKHRFSKETRQFYLGKLMFNREIYDELCADWELKHPDLAERNKNILLKYKY